MTTRHQRYYAKRKMILALWKAVESIKEKEGLMILNTGLI